MKGKKFDAHEKHFKEKEMKLNKEINSLRDHIQRIHNNNMVVEDNNQQLQKDLLEITIKYEKLLEYSKITDVEIKQAILNDKTAMDINYMMKGFRKYML